MCCVVFWVFLAGFFPFFFKDNFKWGIITNKTEALSWARHHPQQSLAFCTASCALEPWTTQTETTEEQEISEFWIGSISRKVLCPQAFHLTAWGCWSVTNLITHFCHFPSLHKFCWGLVPVHNWLHQNSVNCSKRSCHKTLCAENWASLTRLASPHICISTVWRCPQAEQGVCPSLSGHNSPVPLHSGRWPFSPAPRPFPALPEHEDIWQLWICLCSPCLPPTQLSDSSLLIVLCNCLSLNFFGYLLDYVKWEIWRSLGIIILWWVNRALQQELSDYKH